ncbi:hypothetical protein P0Y35_05585 [Kiritimatiellaeota bacterium B1221]|nr:hypothetical protein [Kiritimatiellaeota bacterium B1221]
MNERLTYNASDKKNNWAPLMFPLMTLLIAIAIIPFNPLNDYTRLHLPIGATGITLPVQSIALILLLALSGVLLQRLLPTKSAAFLKAFAGLCGLGIPFIFFQGFFQIDQNPILNFSGTALMLASWIFVLSDHSKNTLYAVASGLFAGLACAVSPLYLSGALALFLFSLFQSGETWKTKASKQCLWILALFSGMTPILYRDLPLMQDEPLFSPEFIRSSLQFVMQNTPIWSWAFVIVGLLVALLQKQKILLGLVLPFFLLLLLSIGVLPSIYFLPGEPQGTFPHEVYVLSWSIAPTLLLPTAWFTAYGMLRVLRGIEQGVRKANPAQAKKIPAFACGAFILGFLFKIADLYYFVG